MPGKGRFGGEFQVAAFVPDGRQLVPGLPGQKRGRRAVSRNGPRRTASAGIFFDRAFAGTKAVPTRRTRPGMPMKKALSMTA